MGSILVRLLDAFSQQGIQIHVGDSETRTQDPDAQFAKAFNADGTLVSSGAGIALGEVMVLEHLLAEVGGNCLVIGNGFGWSAVALGLILRGRGRVVAMDACLEGVEGRRGLDLVNAIAARHNLPLEGVEGLSPWDLPGLVTSHLEGRLDVVLVDSLHSDEQQLLDYEGIRPFLAPGAIVVFHDVLNWRMEASFAEIARRDGRGAELLHRTASGLGVLFPEDGAFAPFLRAFRGQVLPPREPSNVWVGRYIYLASLYAKDPVLREKYLALGLRETAHPETVWMGMAMHHYDRQAWDDCSVCLDRASALRPDWALPAHFAGLVARSQGRSHAEVWGLMSAALGKADAPPDLFVDAGYAAYNVGFIEDAERLGKEAAMRRPEWSLPWHLMALAARKRGAAPAELWPIVAEGLRWPPALKELRFDAAVAARDLGRLVEAAALAEEAAALDPAWEGARALALDLRRRASGT